MVWNEVLVFFGWAALIDGCAGLYMYACKVDQWTRRVGFRQRIWGWFVGFFLLVLELRMGTGFIFEVRG